MFANSINRSHFVALRETVATGGEISWVKQNLHTIIISLFYTDDGDKYEDCHSKMYSGYHIE